MVALFLIPYRLTTTVYPACASSRIPAEDHTPVQFHYEHRRRFCGVIGAMAGRCLNVLGIDLPEGMIEEARKRHPAEGVEYRGGDIEMDLGRGRHDALVGIAAFHHLDLEVVLPEAREPPRENGVPVVPDMYKQEPLTDYLLKRACRAGELLRAGRREQG